MKGNQMLPGGVKGGGRRNWRVGWRRAQLRLD
jgi:hypothetical protein